MRNFKLVATPSKRPGYEEYTDMFLVWSFGEKEYRVRIRPQFGRDYKLLYSVAEYDNTSEEK